MRALLLGPLLLLLLAAPLAGCAHSRRPEGDRLALRKAMAREALGRGQHRAALDLLGELYREVPEDAEVLLMRGVALREQGLFSEAETELAEAVRLAPEEAAIHAAYGVLLDQTGRGEEALEHHRQASELDPGNAAWLNNLAFSSFAQGKTAAAVESYRKALRLAPNDARIRNNLGFAYARQGDFTLAAEQFRRAGVPAEAANNLGCAYELQGNLAQAFEHYLQALRLDPSSAAVRQNLVHLAGRLGRPVPEDVAAQGEAAASGKERGR